MTEPEPTTSDPGAAETERPAPGRMMSSAYLRNNVRGAMQNMPNVMAALDRLIAESPVTPASYAQFKQDASDAFAHIETLKECMTFSLDDPHVAAILNHEETVGKSGTALYAELMQNGSQYGIERYHAIWGQSQILRDFVYT